MYVQSSLSGGSRATLLLSISAVLITARMTLEYRCLDCLDFNFSSTHFHFCFQWVLGLQVDSCHQYHFHFFMIVFNSFSPSLWSSWLSSNHFHFCLCPQITFAFTFCPRSRWWRWLSASSFSLFVMIVSNSFSLGAAESHVTTFTFCPRRLWRWLPVNYLGIGRPARRGALYI